MGNSNTKEAREPADPRANRASPGGPGADQQQQSQHQHQPQQPGFPGSGSSRSRNRTSRGDLGTLLGITHGGGSSSQAPYERRETKQEREARRLERERQARLIERERSLAEEHIDGGYLVTLGTYVGPEDYSKPVVRQLQIERKLAPFWRGLNDFSESWAEHQIVAVARGLPLPAADEIPPEDLIPRPLSADSPSASAQNLQNINNLTVPLGGRTQSVASDKSASARGSAITSPTSAAAPARTGSPFKHRPKALAAALSITSRNGSTTEIAPREVKLPPDPFVNGQPLEVALYKDASECPICFLYYPPYLNHTRCCDQPICSECFVQIKRADPHYPEGHGDGEHSQANLEEQAGLLISEPACCPYCQVPELGVTYDPPPFRRGLVYSAPASSSLGVGSMGTAMSSSSSLASNSLSPTSLTSPGGAPHSSGSGGRRRTQSLSANAPNVITTDRVRPDWATKLAAQRAHIARRAAAATALHTAAFLMGNAENRTFRVGRFSRRNTGGSGAASGPGAVASGSSSNPAAVGGGEPGGGYPGGYPGASGDGTPADGADSAGDTPANRSIPGGGGGRARSRMEDLEEMMFAEAIRLSLAAEEERKRKAEKEERKEAKRKEKEERKAAKAAAKASGTGSGSGTGTGTGTGPYGGSSGHSSASGSSLSLPGLGIGRRRGNSAASNLRVEASVANALAAATSTVLNPTDKGKGVERSDASGSGVSSGEQQQQPSSSSSSSPQQPATGGSVTATTTAAQPIPSPPNRPVGPSHLRQMSSASSVTSSLTNDTPAGSYTGHSNLAAGDPRRRSGLSLGSNASDEGGGGTGGNASGDGGSGGGDDKDPSTSTEPMFNFSSLAEMVGVQLEGENAGRRLSAIGRDAIVAGKAAAAGSGSGSSSSSPAAEEDGKDDDDDGGSSGGAGSGSSGSVGKVQSLAAAAAQQQQQRQQSTPEVTITPGTPAPDDTDGFEDSKRQLGFHHETTTVHHHTSASESVS